MQRIDAIILAALVLAAAGSALGALAYEDDRRATFTVSWTTSDVEFEVPVAGGASPNDIEAMVDVAERNVTHALWTVTVSGAPARATSVAIHVEVVAPDNTSATADGELPAGPTGTIDVPVELALAAIPEATRVTGATVDAARASLDTELGSANGTGTWTIRVSLAPTAPGPLGGAEDLAVAIQATLTLYEAEVALESPEVSRG